ncbi:hypothetical protein VNO80_28470 [Phaseolus coccineus]|uniref:F-box associated beta-propeller type 1 domain-containing protein n=1 Tax=Phaseolus coccineus TaxID=3886 RepID=A0AAN9LBK4_PHACN
MRLKRVVKSLRNKLFLHQTAAGALHPQRRHSPPPTHLSPTATTPLRLPHRTHLQPHQPIPYHPHLIPRLQDPQLLQRPPLHPKQHLPLHLQPRHPSNQTGSHVMPFNYVGFGFSPLADDYKIVRISMCVIAHDDPVVLKNVRVDRAEVYSLTSGSWSEIDAAKLQPLCLVSSSVAITGTIFWLASMTSASGTHYEFMVSFDVGRELFTLMSGPPMPSSPSRPYSNDVLAVCNDKLAMFRHYIVGNFKSSSFDLWVLKDFNDKIVCRKPLAGGDTAIVLFDPASKILKQMQPDRDELFYVPFTYIESLVPV